MRIEETADSAAIRALLAGCGLDGTDISPVYSPRFFGIRFGRDLVALVGLETFGECALLRSLAVAPAWRGQGLARQLVTHTENVAVAQGVTALNLLTTTAAGFFVKLGYVPAARADAPPAIQATPQFSGLCPATAAFLVKPLADR